MSTRPAASARRATTRTRRAEARERILAAAERLLRERPYRELSVEDVMAEAGLSRTVFYRHFDGLAELVLARMRGIGDELFAELSEEPGPEFQRTVLTAAVDSFARHGTFMRAVHDAASHDADIEAAYRAYVDTFTDAMAALFEESIAAGRAPAGDPHELARALNLMNVHYLLDTLGRDPGFDRELVLQTLLTIWRAVVQDPD
jgi:TetR/AcrR family transcriptional regulator, ethionamide resistance regulator